MSLQSMCAVVTVYAVGAERTLLTAPDHRGYLLTRVRISNVSIVADGRVEVRFESRLGDGIGTWCGPAPCLYGNYDIELEIPETLEWNVSIFRTDISMPSISNNDGFSIIVGEIEFFDKEDVASIRIGDDVVLLELYNNRQSGFVVIRTASILLYNINL